MNSLLSSGHEKFLVYWSGLYHNHDAILSIGCVISCQHKKRRGVPLFDYIFIVISPMAGIEVAILSHLAGFCSAIRKWADVYSPGRIYLANMTLRLNVLTRC